MDLDRRKLLARMVGTGAASLLAVIPDMEGSSALPASWHRLTRSLLARVARRPTRPDTRRIERVIRELADAQGRTIPPVIKWLETPSDAFNYLSSRGLPALLDMGEASFWRGVPRRCASARRLQSA